ncbi:hypothetical protein ACLB1R_19475 [Escherichia coli]
MVEQVLNEPFIANPLNLSPRRRMLIITGPNMGGKSTLYAPDRTDCADGLHRQLCTGTKS